jgi:hypothetical protein
MKNKIILLLLLVASHIHAQPVILKGKIKCQHAAVNSTKGAEQVIVVPAFVPNRSTITVTRPSGYYELNTGMPLETLQDKTIQVHLIYRCGKECGETVIRAFVSSDQDRENSDGSKCYVTLGDWNIDNKCTAVEMPGRMADSMLRVIVKQPAQPIADISNASALAGSPALLNLLTTLTTIASLSNAGGFNVISLNPGKIQYGQFLLSAAMFHTANNGFNFSPGRDFSEAVFWNPSSMSFSRTSSNISGFTNAKNIAKLSGFTKVNDRLRVGLGAIYSGQDEFRFASYKNINNNNQVDADSLALKLNEISAHLSGAYRINQKVSVGVSVKVVGQNFSIPDSLFIDGGDNTTTYFNKTINKNAIDVDISATWRINNSWQLGINLMNLAGSKLHADAFIPQQQVLSYTNQRAAGLGLLYRNKRWNAGVDILATEDDLYDVALGVNYVPFNRALISAGIAFRQLSYSLAFRLKHFRVAFIDDNNYLINEKNKGKISLLNGRIYSGFVFDF